MSSHTRKLQQIQNNIVQTLVLVGVNPDDVEFVKGFPIKKIPAQMTWYGHGYFCHVSCNKAGKLIDNFSVILGLLKEEVAEVSAGTLEVKAMFRKFEGENEVFDDQKAARKFFEIESDHFDFETIQKKYKKLSKTHHPDMPEGSEEKFKELNKHHKVLKKELE